MLALHIPLICSITFKLWSGAYLTFRLIKQVTIDTIHKTQDAVKVLWVCRHYSRHAAWPTVVLRFMKTCWKTLVLSTQNLI